MVSPLDIAKRLKAEQDAKLAAAAKAEADKIAAEKAAADAKLKVAQEAADAKAAADMKPITDNKAAPSTASDSLPTATATTTSPVNTNPEVTTKRAAAEIPNPDVSNNNIKAIDDVYSLVDKAVLEVKYSIDTGWGFGKIRTYGILNNDIYTDKSSKEHLKVADDHLTAKLVDDVKNGMLELSKDEGTFKYTPNKGFSGADYFTYQVCNLKACSNVATVTITMKNYAPKANDDNYKIREGTVLNADTPKGMLGKTGLITYGVLNNDEDKNNNQLYAELQSNVKHGKLAFNKDGTFTYTPNPEYYGNDSFSYKTFDGIDYSNVAKVFITIERNNAPVALDDQYKLQGKTLDANRVKDTSGFLGKIGLTYGVLNNDIDSNKDPLKAILVENPKHGKLEFKNDGTFKYIQDIDYCGDDYFKYKASDGTLESNLASVYLVAECENHGEL